jgi:hypothetical protein
VLSHKDAGTTGVGDKKPSVEIPSGFDGHVTLEVKRFSFHLIGELERSACVARQLGGLSPSSQDPGRCTTDGHRLCNACGAAFHLPRLALSLPLLSCMIRIQGTSD